MVRALSSVPHMYWAGDLQALYCETYLLPDHRIPRRREWSASFFLRYTCPADPGPSLWWPDQYPVGRKKVDHDQHCKEITHIDQHTWKFNIYIGTWCLWNVPFHVSHVVKVKSRLGFLPRASDVHCQCYNHWAMRINVLNDTHTWIAHKKILAISFVTNTYKILENVFFC